MDDSQKGSELFEVLRHLAIVSAALSHHPTNRSELLATRDLLLRAARDLGFPVTAEQAQRLYGRLSSMPEPPEENSSRLVRDHGEILRWAAAHDVMPAEVRRPVFDSQPSSLRFVSGPARAGTPDLRPISWEDFFARFDLMRLALLLEDDDEEWTLVDAVDPPVDPSN